MAVGSIQFLIWVVDRLSARGHPHFLATGTAPSWPLASSKPTRERVSQQNRHQSQCYVTRSPLPYLISSASHRFSPYSGGGGVQGELQEGTNTRRQDHGSSLRVIPPCYIRQGVGQNMPDGIPLRRQLELALAEG